MMQKRTISRKTFIRQSSLQLAGLSLLSNKLMADTSILFPNKEENMEHTPYTLYNVLMETGFHYADGEVRGTKTALFAVDIAEGKIQAIRPQSAKETGVDMQGLLLLPAFKDMHIHLDKTFYGAPWRAVKARKNGIKGMIALEQDILPEMLETSTEKAEKLIELLQSKGSTFARSHVNIEPTSGLRSLKNLQKALSHKKESFGAELVAFPQHGVYYTESAGYLKEAAQMDIDFIGGLDPYTLDGAIEKTMDFTVQLALDYKKGIDIHLHETGESGLKTVEYLIAKVLENPILKGKTFLSHCFILSRLEERQCIEIAEKLAEAEIGIISTVPLGKLTMPLPTLMERGVRVLTGNDSIIDHWNTYGTGSVLQKANLAAQLYGHSTEYELSRMLKLANVDVLPLDNHGSLQWPKPGDTADLAFLYASCSAEAVSRTAAVKSLIYKGNRVF